MRYPKIELEGAVVAVTGGARGIGKATSDLFAAKGATLYGVSCDAHYSQTAFQKSLGIEIEQLSDFEPKGAACAAFGVLHPGGFPQRALVVIDPDGTVRWSFEAPSPSDLPGGPRRRPR